MSNHNDDMNTKDFLIGSLIGGIVGASVALLFAPKSGKELREDINTGATYVKDKASDWKDVAYDKGTEWKDYAVDASGQFTKNVSEKSQQLGDRVKHTSKTIQDKVNSFRNNEEDTVSEEFTEAVNDLENNRNQ
ncbi:YtxH domain-containing protein [Radiobacillus deserti]|uniref:YtxH domain-containing protein n=1 Tax=Radiobacillus deserti TaxID=2594883 RepID=A0A516KHL7_9BACI|nr:YtxH domain-containing protein [Radiobacillus deserti]QDP40898.1 YtxH domain-containing protein [Radiobacillus deserti]